MWLLKMSISRGKTNKSCNKTTKPMMWKMRKKIWKKKFKDSNLKKINEIQYRFSRKISFSIRNLNNVSVIFFIKYLSMQPKIRCHKVLCPLDKHTSCYWFLRRVKPPWYRCLRNSTRENHRLQSLIKKRKLWWTTGRIETGSL